MRRWFTSKYGKCPLQVKYSGKRPSWLQKRPCLLRLCSVFSKLLCRQAVPPGNDLPIQTRMASQAQGRLAEVRLLPNPGVGATGNGTWRQGRQAPHTGSVRTGDRKDLTDALRLQIQSRHAAWEQGSMYKMTFIESILETDSMKGFWFRAHSEFKSHDRS